MHSLGLLLRGRFLRIVAFQPCQKQTAGMSDFFSIEHRPMLLLAIGIVIVVLAIVLTRSKTTS
jgi:hypothetical protein